MYLLYGLLLLIFMKAIENVILVNYDVCCSAVPTRTSRTLLSSEIGYSGGATPGSAQVLQCFYNQARCLQQVPSKFSD